MSKEQHLMSNLRSMGFSNLFGVNLFKKINSVSIFNSIKTLSSGTELYDIGLNFLLSISQTYNSKEAFNRALSELGG